MLKEKQIIIDGNVYNIVEESDEVVVDDTPRKDKIIARIREKYSLDDEIALIRQKDTKKEEFEEYNREVEKIKSEV